MGLKPSLRRRVESAEASACFRALRLISRPLRASRGVTHFFVKLVFAAPASFFSFADASQVVFASFSHLVRKLFIAAPASFFSSAWDLHVARLRRSGERQKNENQPGKSNLHS